MSTLTAEDLRTIGAQLRRTAQLIGMQPACDHPRRCTTNAEHALAVSRDWQVPLSAAKGPGPKNQPGDPTGNAAMRGDDELARQHGALVRDLRTAHRTCSDLAARLLNITVPARVENQRAGIGHCESCTRYCDGASDSQRLRAGLCNACRQRHARRQAQAKACTRG